MTTAITQREFQRLREMARGHFGLDLRPGKESLVQARLGKRLHQLGLESFGQYLDHVAGDRTGEELVLLVDALTTNFTSFLREADHFTFLEKTVLRQLRDRAAITIWCAGCASGEEAYSILFSSLEAVKGRPVKVMATDISNRALSIARSGIYRAEKAANLPEPWLRRYLQRGDGQWEGYVRVKPAYRALVEFSRLNLMDSFQGIPKVPVIFCRNVMIYFDRATQCDLVQRLVERLEPGGYLLIGHSEGLSNVQSSLEFVRPATYKRVGQLR